jgi:methionine-gamma-lyase
MQGFGGMICFDLKGGVEAGTALMNRVKLCSLAVSLGDTRTLITHPASTTHSVDAWRGSPGVTDARAALGRPRRRGPHRGSRGRPLLTKSKGGCAGLA